MLTEVLISVTTTEIEAIASEVYAKEKQKASKGSDVIWGHTSLFVIDYYCISSGIVGIFMEQVDKSWNCSFSMTFGH